MIIKFDGNVISVETLENSIAQQQRILSQLDRLGEPTALAERFLGRLQETLALRRDHARRVR